MGGGAEEESGLDPGLWDLRFALPETERDFQIWRVQRTLGPARIGIALALVAFGLFVAGVGAATPQDFGVIAELVFGGAVPVILVPLVASYLPRARAWFLPLSALGNAAAGLVITGVVRAIHDPTPNFAAAVGLTSLVICQYFAFTMQRLRPPDAALAAGVYLAAYLATLIGWQREGRIGAAMFIASIAALAAGLLTGLIACGFSERQSRSSYRQERIIEAQRLTIARERARAEELLKQELSHQVAARSRELGRMLARVDATLFSGRPVVGGRFDTRYQVLRELGAGGMGAVYEVERSTDGQRLALKVVTGEVSPARAARFAREAEIGARIHHPNVVPIVDVGVADGIPFLAMELAPQGSLEDRRAGFGDGAWATPLLADIARGLVALHDAGVVHRDLKPANVLLVAGEDRDTVAKISDFGISRFGELESLDADPEASTVAAKRATHALTATGMLLGTPNYMAPETAAGARVEAPADVFSFGILACELLTGRSPFTLPPMLSALASEPLRAPLGLDDARIPEGIRGAIRACLSEAPADRPTMREIAAALA